MSVDIVRSKDFGGSARLKYPSEMQGNFKAKSVHQDVDREAFYSPCDRIGRFNTPSAAGLTMKQATKVAKAMMTQGLTSSGANIMNYSLAATAPDAFEASHRIKTKAFQKDTNRNDTKAESKRKKKDLPVNTSKTALRDAHRFDRSPKPFHDLPPSPNTLSLRGGAKEGIFFPEGNKPNFDDWDPEPLYGSEQQAEKMSDELKKEMQYDTLENSSNAIDLILTSGVPTALGSGHRLPVPTLPLLVRQNILQKIPPSPDYFDTLVCPELEEVQNEELQEVENAYCYAAARASFEYDIKDKVTAEELGVYINFLNDNIDSGELWYSKEFVAKEWRVLRQTGVDSERVMRSFRVLESCLCNVLPIMVQLQHLWDHASLPQAWWEGVNSSIDRCTYAKLLFTDVNQPRFHNRLPLPLDKFSNHIERHCEEIREALIEYWLISAGTMLRTYESDNFGNEEAVTLLEADSTPPEEQEDDGEGGEFKQFIQDHPLGSSQRALQQRIENEGLDSNVGSGSGTVKKVSTKAAGSTTSVRNKATRMMDCAAVLMSRQLREMCESSLRSMLQLFEQANESTKDNNPAVFVIDVKLRKKVRKDVTTEFSEPVEVCLQPDADFIKHTLSTSVRQIVSCSRDFPMADQGGGRSNKSIRANKKLNDSAVAFSDYIVTDTVSRLYSAVDDFFEGPTELLKHFDELEDLLSGTEASRVEKAIENCTDGDDVLENLDILGEVCNNLEAMIESIKNIVEDVCYFPMFEVRCFELKEILVRYARSLHTRVLEAIVEENRTHMLAISNQYQDIANRLTAECADSAELKALQDFTAKCAITLTELYDQYTNVCYERCRFLLNHQFKLGREDIQVVYTTFNWPANIQFFLRRSYESQAVRKRELEELLEEDQRKLENDLNDIAKRVELVAENASPMEFRKNVERIAAIKRDLESKRERAEEIAEREALLEMPFSDHLPRVDSIQEAVEPLERLWNTTKAFIEKTHMWNEAPLAEVDAEEAQRVAEDLYRTLTKVNKDLGKQGEKRSAARRIAESMQSEVKEFLNENIPLMLLTCNPGMKDRHWEQIEQVTGVTIPSGEGVQLTTAMLLDCGLQHHTKDIEEICIAANKEHGLFVAMGKMEKEWEPMIFETKEYRTTGTRILSSIDEIQQLLDDQIVKTQAMRGSRFIKPFLEQITKWEETLVAMQDILDNWLKVQATWLYLEPIFSSDDIMRQMPTEGKMFRAVDNTWRESMAQTYEAPGCITVARRPGFLDSLIEANKKLEVIQKGLNDYLETKRLAFPRFFFLSNDELLEILAETKDPLRVQPHLKKCFDGVSKLRFESNLDITACFDPSGEKVDFPYDKVNHRKINPNDSGGNVERWLIEVEAMMRKSLAYAIDFAMKDFLESDRIEWLQRWQGQVIICINQSYWCGQVEKSLNDGAAGHGLSGLYKILCDELLRTVELVRGNISKALRTAVGALVVMDVHNRDVVNEMTEVGVEKVTDFDWLAQLRYYWNAEGESAQTGLPDTVTCIMINAKAMYAYEYIGNQGRLVITPLTDRCYRTLMGAIHLNLGGAPEGPAGTGKTESVKDLAKAIAIQCVVTNCSDGLDFLAMAKFFKGLASSGAWACFDEFNRIQLEVLSVVAQQIMQIQQAKLKKLTRFVFEGTELDIRPTCCPFITMNPGYAGRAELPDNLKVLFRTVAMMVPDYAMISEIILYSFGYTTGKVLSVKIVTTYKLCSEQLSSQSHYDYGMRAVVAVLRAAGNLKRSDGHLPEDVLVLRSIIDVNLPKFLSPDVPLFNGIVSDLFPGVVIDPPDTTAMKEAFEASCEAMSLMPETYFWEKVVQIYDMMVVRHGFMIVGAPFSGKTMAWSILAKMLEYLHDKFPDDKRWSGVIPIRQNPKSISMGQLYGMFDPVSHEWTDGILAINFRNAASDKVGTPNDRKWILFDGPVDAIWIENMNTVLDDNKKLCLMSGEIIAMSDKMSMMFEPMDLLVASPATVSRCGMIYMEPEQLGWSPILDAWVEKNKEGGKFVAIDTSGDTDVVLGLQLLDIDIAYVRELFGWLVEPCLCFVRKEVSEMSPTVDSALVVSLLNIFDGLMARALKKYAKADGEEELDDSTKTKLAKQRIQDIECCFVFALVWSIGKTGSERSQGLFSAFLENIISSLNCIESDFRAVHNALQMRSWKPPDFTVAKHVKGTLSLPMPFKVNFFECVYLPEDSKWKSWVDLMPSYTIPPTATYTSIVVPNACSTQVAFMLDLLLKTKKHVLVCGPTGTGKSAYVNDTITKKLPQDVFKTFNLGFSAKTSANMTQDIIDGKLDKRRKGVYGPPMGMRSIIFVDDLNMPEVEEYGAQPPIELIRQLIDNGGWYDLKEKSWKSIVEVSLVAAMGPPGGGRNFVTPRLLRHFNLLCFAEFDDDTLRRIFNVIVNWHFNKGFTGEIKNLAGAVVEATLETFRAAMAHLLPTPKKSHYTFNLRDFSRVIQGVLLSKPSTEFNKQSLTRLWAHEALRVFCDRLIDEQDREWFQGHIENMCTNKFSCNFYEFFKHLDKEETKTISVQNMRNLFWGDYVADDSSYSEVTDMALLQEKMEGYLEDYNQQSRKPMDLVMFGFAIEHVSRITRILRMPGGNALLAGVGGSGRQSVCRLAAHMCEYTLFQIEISKNYTNTEWREDLKTILRGAGAGSQPMTFLFSDTQIKNETFVEDINNMLNSGEVPNIFPADEKAQIAEAVRPFAKAVFGKASADMTQNDLYAFFISRVRENLHIVLAFSPIGDAFRDRLRKFPALINSCTIDWFTAWPSDALVAVAQRFLAPVKFRDDDTRQNIVSLCQQFHMDVIALSDEFNRKLKRINYVTPTSYLELILAFKQNLDKKRDEVASAKKRYEVGLDKLSFAAEQVNAMQRELEDLQPELVESAAATEVLMGQIEEKMPGVLETRKIVGAEAAVAQTEADIVQAQKDDVEKDLAVAIPALEEAIAALNTIKPTDINEIKALSKPPEKIKMVCRAVCVMLDIKPARIPDPDDPSKRIMDYWGPSQKMLADVNFINNLISYDKDNMNPKIVAEIKKNYIENEEFEPAKIAKASKAAEGMCRWCFAMITYDRVAKVVAPKKAALAEAEAKLKATMDALNAKKDALKKIEDDLAALEQSLENAKQKKCDLENQATACDTKIVRANQLLDGLGGEKDRWGTFVEELGEQFLKLTGDVLVSSGVLAYLGPFTANYRQKQTAKWVDALKSNNIFCSEKPSLTTTLGDPVKIRQWNIDGLPTDNFSVNNGIVVFNARRWPLMIDPQGQANKWIRNMEKSCNLQVIKLTDTNYLRALENSIQFGSPVLLENVGEELDPSLEPLLQKQLFKQGGVLCIRLGDATVEYSDMFRFYITTKLRNPHYLPEVSVKVTLLNFMITPEGLEDQLLGIVVSEERPDLEAQRNALIVESAENKRLLKEIEDRILHIMSSSSGNILEDETAIETLKGSKTLSDEISVKQAIGEETEKTINEVRLSYNSVAYYSQILFFCIADLANIEPVYQYSLTWFINLFIDSIKNSEKGRDVKKRLENLSQHFTYSLYRNVCRSLLEKDKLLFSFLLTTRILAGQGKLDKKEWYFTLTGGIGLDNPHKPPDAPWLNSKCWDEICRLADIPKFSSFREDFVANIEQWQIVYDSLTPQEEVFPGIFENERGLGRLCALRTIRPDKVVLAVQKFCVEYMEEKYVKPPPFDLQSCYADSSAVVPLVFILSPGSDPMSAVFRAADILKTTVDPISLGQGQGPKAERLIERAKQKGTWVVLQNCHLAPSWMNTLEKICEELDPDEVHANFRLWCTTYPSPIFPVAVLQNGVKMTNEPPKGLRANLMGTYNADPISNEEFYDGSSKPYEFHRLLFGLCFFHAVIQERRLYGPLGWNIPYEFNESDLRISVQQLFQFLEDNDTTPFKALRYTAGECNYGGRVTDDKDRRTLMCILSRFYDPDFLCEEHDIVPGGIFFCPPDGPREDFISYIDGLPLVADPCVFGFHDNATLTRDQNDTNSLLASVLDTEGGDEGDEEEGALSREDVIANTAMEIADKIPPNFDMEMAQLKYPVLWEESMNTVLCQELIRFNRLLSCIRDSLVNIQKAVKGLVVMSSELEVLANSLFFNKLPVMWKSKSYPSLKPLSSYVTDLQARLRFFDSWLQTSPPSIYWISGFFFTQAFLTGASQNFARRYTIPIDDVVYDFEMMKEVEYSEGPNNGVYTQGLFLEGARWCRDTFELAESLPKILFSPAPVIHFSPFRTADIPKYSHYNCPVYKTSDRRGVLATTGHSSNFVCFIKVPSNVKQEHWVERGVAMLTQLDD